MFHKIFKVFTLLFMVATSILNISRFLREDDKKEREKEQERDQRHHEDRHDEHGFSFLHLLPFLAAGLISLGAVLFIKREHHREIQGMKLI